MIILYYDMKKLSKIWKNAIQLLHLEHELWIKENKAQTCRIHWKKLQVNGCKANYRNLAPFLSPATNSIHVNVLPVLTAFSL